MLAEIERLQRKAEARRRIEIKGVVKHIRELIAKHGLSSHDLGLDGGKATAAPRQFQDLVAALPARGRKAGRPAKAATSKGVARYRDPATGKTWTGRGKPPNWIAGAKDRSAFEIGAAAAPVKAAAGRPAKATKAVKSVKAVKAKRVAKAAKAARKPVAEKPVAKKAAAKRAAPAKAAQAAKPAKSAKAPKAPKAVKLPKAPAPKAARKKAPTPKPAKPAPAPADSGAGAAPTPAPAGE